MRRYLLIVIACLLLLLPAGTARAEVPDPPGSPTWEATDLLSSVGADDIAFGDALHGCICTQATGFFTADGGETWTEQPAMAGLYSLAYGDAEHVWGCDDTGRIAASSDGGATWGDQTSGVDWTLDSIEFVDATHGWAISSFGAVLRTTNGGLTWESVGACTGGDEEYWTLSFVDALHGWATSGPSYVWVTVDGGVTWEQREHTYWYSTFAIDFADLQHGWAGTGDGVYLTDDDGETWALAAYPSGSNWLQAVDVVALDNERVWAITPGGVSLVSGDGGATWHFQTVDWRGSNSWSSGYSLCVVGDEGWAVRWRGDDYPEPVVAHTSRSGYGDAVPPVTTLAPETLPDFTRTSFSCSLNATDQGSGVAHTYYCLRQGEYAPAVWQEGTTFATPTTDGQWYIDYCSEDAYGNVEPVHEQRLVVDTSAPVTSFAPASKYELDYWINYASTVTIDAHDPWPGSGLGAIMVSLGSAPYVEWVRRTAVVTEAPRDHSNDGRHRIRAYSSDTLGNVEAVQTHTVAIDTRKPVCKLPYPLSCVSGGYLTMKFRLNDTRPCPSSGIIEIRVKTLGGKLVGQVLPGKWFAKNKLLSYRFRVPLRPGTYRLLLRANDGAGNISGWATRKLTVRKKTSSFEPSSALLRAAAGDRVAGTWGADVADGAEARGLRAPRASVD